MAVGGGVKPTASILTSRPYTVNPLKGNLVSSGFVLGGFALLIIAILLGLIPYSTLLSAILGIAAGLFGLLRVGKNTDALHPVRVFGAIWCLCLALVPLKLTTTITDWPLSVWSYVILALLSFIGGFWLTSRRVSNGQHLQGEASESELPPSEMLEPRRALRVALVCLTVGISAFSYEYWLIGGIPVLAQKIDAARTIFFATAGRWSHPEFDTLFYKIVGILTTPCKYAVYLAIILLIQKNRKTRAQIVMAAAIIVCGALALASQGGRSPVIDILIFSGILFHYMRRRLTSKHLSILGLILSLFISFAGYYRYLHGRQDAFHIEVERVSKLPRGPLGDSIVVGYQSLTSPLETFARFTNDFPTMRPPSAGFLFYSFHRLLPRTNIEEYTYHLYYGSLTNTFLGEFYGDFGFLGIILGPFILGMGYGYVYFRALCFKSLYWLCMESVFVGILIYFPYMNLFSQQLTWIFDLSALAILIPLAKPGKKRQLLSLVRAPGTARPAATLSRAHFHH